MCGHLSASLRERTRRTVPAVPAAAARPLTPTAPPPGGRCLRSPRGFPPGRLVSTPQPLAGNAAAPAPISNTTVPVRGWAPPGGDRRLLPADSRDTGAAERPPYGLRPCPRGPGGSRRPPAPLPRSRPLLRPVAAAWGWAGRRHPPLRAPPPGREAEEAAAWAGAAGAGGAGNGGRAGLSRAEGGDESRAMRLLRALLRGASPGSIPQQVDFYSRFSPSPLSMKQFLDFGESPPARHPRLSAALPAGCLWGAGRGRGGSGAATSSPRC